MLKQVLKIPIICVLLIGTTWPDSPTPAQTTSGRATVVNVRVNGIEAHARSEFQSSNGCVLTVLNVFANLGAGTDNLSGRPTGPIAIVYSGSIDFCNGGQILFNGTGSVDLSPGQFIVDKSLATAALKVTVPVYDLVSGNTFNFDVDLNWIATSPPQEGRTVFSEKYADGTEEFAHSSGTFRDAIAMGTVLNGSVNLTPDPLGGDIESVKEGDLTLTKPVR